MIPYLPQQPLDHLDRLHSDRDHTPDQIDYSVFVSLANSINAIPATKNTVTAEAFAPIPNALQHLSSRLTR
jgi:hypothetical protein